MLLLRWRQSHAGACNYSQALDVLMRGTINARASAAAPPPYFPCILGALPHTAPAPAAPDIGGRSGLRHVGRPCATERLVSFCREIGGF
jgi:hypothetical protein